MARYVNPIVAKKRERYPRTGADLDRKQAQEIAADVGRGASRRDEIRRERQQRRQEESEDVRLREEGTNGPEDGGAAEVGGERADAEADTAGGADQDPDGEQADRGEVKF